MKTLDVQALHKAIDQTLEQLKHQSDEFAKVKKAVEGITSLDDALKGKGGDAIRAFYEECHTPFLRFYDTFIVEYRSTLKKLKSALNSLEPNHNGFISQSFLEHELEQGANAADRTTKRLVSKTNATIAKVSHIVDLPDLNDSDFHEQNRKALKEINQTIEKLHTFDREQTNALKTAEQDLETMQKYITELEKMYTGPKIEITSYKKGSILKPDENTNINGPVGGLKGELENAEPSPMEIMLKKLSDQEESEVDSLTKADHSKKIDTGIRIIKGKVYNMKGYKKLGSVDVTDEIGTGKDFVGGSYMLYSNGQIVRKYISGGEVKYELVSRIPESRVKKSDIEKALDWAKDTVGELSGGYDGYRAITGVDPVTGEKLSVTDRILSGVSVIPATKVVKVGKYVFKANKGAKTAKRVSTSTAKRPGGYLKEDVDEHGYLSPGVNRAPGNKNIASDNRVQSHHPIQNEWAKRWAKEGGFDYNEKKASAILLPSSSGHSHAKISSMQRKRRKIEGFNTDIRYEFNVSYREMIEAGVDQKATRKAMKDAYKYFDGLGGFVK
ncbi:MAG: transposase [Bacillus sp. (in: Bacteria)]|uniref:T7SS effector LXG polymorphic toxin n=1 Tax=Bacillus TaxID=1386 RepID=UPI0018D0D101|nr:MULTISPECIES: T7SS effector LXG polymorphic toxin [Bacillus]MBW4886168.1 transposase [Bacillus sp. (in: firmicutes)]WAJ13399.1 T7SS effector LXG polymorphic toxin [Bacillus paralicheniformis]